MGVGASRREALLALLAGNKRGGTKGLAEYRQQIDRIDRRIAGLLEERAEAVRRIGRVKRARGMPIEALEREQQVLRNVTRAARTLPPEAVKRIYERILEEMKALE